MRSPEHHRRARLVESGLAAGRQLEGFAGTIRVFPEVVDAVGGTGARHQGVTDPAAARVTDASATRATPGRATSTCRRLTDFWKHPMQSGAPPPEVEIAGTARCR